jgi:hypothetical protein
MTVVLTCRFLSLLGLGYEDNDLIIKYQLACQSTLWLVEARNCESIEEFVRQEKTAANGKWLTLLVEAKESVANGE